MNELKSHQFSKLAQLRIGQQFSTINEGDIMCNSIIVETHYNYDEVIEFFEEVFGKAYSDYYQIDILWSCAGVFNEVELAGFNNECFCNIKDEDKIKLFDFILKISNRA